MLERKVMDARGVVFGVPPPNPVVGEVQEGSAPARLNALRAEFYGAPSGMVRRVVNAVVVGGALGGLVLHFGVQAMAKADQFGVIAIAVIAAAGAGFAMFRLGVRTPDYSVVGAGMAEMRVCLVCGYELGSVPRAGDGCTVCPECGAAWRME